MVFLILQFFIGGVINIIKKLLPIIFIAPIIIYCLFSFGFFDKPTYRPMFYYDGYLYADVAQVSEGITEDMHYLGTINEVISDAKKPTKNFQSNSAPYLRCNLYIDEEGTIFIALKSGKILRTEVIE